MNSRPVPEMQYASVVSEAPLTRGVEVYDVLHAELLNGVLCPGAKLRLVELAQRFSVSQSVIREALTRLAAQGLVTATPQRGFRVRELSVEDIEGLTEARVRIEPIALRLAIERGDEQWESGIVAAHHLLERTPILNSEQMVDEQWAARHREFHQALTAGCHNARLEGVVQGLRDSAELYRRWYWALTDHHHRDLAKEHRRLTKLALSRDTDAAAELLVAHIAKAPKKLIAFARARSLDNLDERPVAG
ncbi:GntR family transcriptional regulator [Mycobacterium sp. AZCC_0083]|uniref:GntR family transcriptional regulator n=1 Tax=Mycobacterium sp. AZCC_0083 TaxID=2735882 RepID=UPI0017F0A328|nr:GntR family transcriptional regulator [Mycobacterium sp. AZCC_0083]MBB5168619.1 DNA-binding GntR family transcriptional regulator [Mycobacterium sp. AZCC_0083]